VACVDPAQLLRTASALTAILPTARLPVAMRRRYPTGFVSYPAAVTGGCSSAGDADVLLVRATLGGVSVAALSDSNWDLHTIDITVALADLSALVGREANAYH
jgi:hypothetical protein